VRQRDQVDELTASLRADSGPLWARIRWLLEDRGVDASKSLLLDFFTDDSDLYWGLIVTPEGRAFQFDFDYLRRQPAEGRFSSWEDVTEATGFAHAGPVELGLSRLEDEKGTIL